MKKNEQKKVIILESRRGIHTIIINRNSILKMLTAPSISPRLSHTPELLCSTYKPPAMFTGQNKPYLQYGYSEERWSLGKDRSKRAGTPGHIFSIHTGSSAPKRQGFYCRLNSLNTLCADNTVLPDDQTWRDY